jgi:hypothetical protein
MRLAYWALLTGVLLETFDFTEASLKEEDVTPSVPQDSFSTVTKNEDEIVLDVESISKTSVTEELPSSSERPGTEKSVSRLSLLARDEPLPMGTADSRSKSHESISEEIDRGNPKTDGNLLVELPVSPVNVDSVSYCNTINAMSVSANSEKKSPSPKTGQPSTTKTRKKGEKLVRSTYRATTKADFPEYVFDPNKVEKPVRICRKAQLTWDSPHGYSFKVDPHDLFLEDYDFLVPDFATFFKDLKERITGVGSWADPAYIRSLEELIERFSDNSLCHAWKFENVLLDAASRSSSPGIVGVLLASVIPIEAKVNTVGLLKAVEENPHFQDKSLAAPLLYLASLWEPRSKLNQDVTLHDWICKYEIPAGVIPRSVEVPGPIACKSLSSELDFREVERWFNRFDPLFKSPTVTSVSNLIIDFYWLNVGMPNNVVGRLEPDKKREFQVFYRTSSYLGSAYDAIVRLPNQGYEFITGLSKPSNPIQSIAEEIVLDFGSSDTVTYLLRAAMLKDGRFLVFSFKRRMWYIADEQSSRAIPFFCAHAMMVSDAERIIYVSQECK